MSTKIESVEVTNLKAIKHARADFKGSSCIVMAGNGKGKTTLISLLIQRFRGLTPDILLKESEENGNYTMVLVNGDRFEWNVDEKKGYNLADIKYITQDGAVKLGVTKLIAERFFPKSFDIDDFLSSGPKDQKKILEDIAGISFDSINARYETAYNDRTDKNKEVKRAETLLKPVLKEHPLEVGKPMPIEALDIIKIQQDIANIDSHNKTYDLAVKGISEITVKKASNIKEIDRLKKLIDGLEKENTALDKRAEQGNKWVAKKENKRKEDNYLVELNTKLQSTIDLNKKIEENNKAISDKESYDELVIEANDLDEKVKGIELEKTNLIKTAKLPEGFAFSATGILYNGLPFTKQQQSLSDLYIAALKLASLNIGEVKMLHFEASALDDISLEAVQKWADEQDLQIIVELPLRSGGNIEYHIIDKTGN